MEKKRQEDMEREALLRAAKSRYIGNKHVRRCPIVMSECVKWFLVCCRGEYCEEWQS